MPTIAGMGIPSWRWLLADIDGSNITLLDRHARDRSISYRLNTPTQMMGTVSSDDPEINMIHTDGFPVLTEGDRLLYCFRRDYGGDFDAGDPWQVRAAGVILQLDDDAFAENANSRFVAYDPWQVLYRKPVINPNVSVADQGLFDTEYQTQPVNDIIIDMLENMVDFSDPIQSGAPAYAFLDWGWSGSLYQGTIETLPPITHLFQKEQSIGEGFDNLCARGVVDIVIDPIYDPVNRPGIVGELSIYNLVGDLKPEAIFAWDKPSRSTVEISRNINGNERANNIRLHAGQGGASEVVSTVVSTPSVVRFGEYWQTQFYVAENQEESISEYAQQLLDQFAEHAKTVTVTVAPERCPDPFLEWFVGDLVRVFASKKFRSIQEGFQRAIAFELAIGNTALETVTNLEIYIPNDQELDEILGPEMSVASLIAEGAFGGRYKTHSKLRKPFT